MQFTKYLQDTDSKLKLITGHRWNSGDKGNLIIVLDGKKPNKNWLQACLLHKQTQNKLPRCRQKKRTGFSAYSTSLLVEKELQLESTARFHPFCSSQAHKSKNATNKGHSRSACQHVFIVVGLCLSWKI